ncbi:MAG: sigma-70 family RNA polymerase sigma factor [Ilumatobacter fluminis]|uniref:RNA polymerase sigma factor n=1 Tax=Ilumatobacter fluminis TaxID=467091 RepID=UPI0032F02A1A
MTDEMTFDEFVAAAMPRLHRALLGSVGVDRLDDAVAEAVAWAFEHQAEISAMDNPVGYMYRVGVSKVRRRRRLRLFRDVPVTIPDVEPGLVDAMLSLPESQRTAVWLAHGCHWTHTEIAEVMDLAPSTVATHVSRGMHSLRKALGVIDAHA